MRPDARSCSSIATGARTSSLGVSPPPPPLAFACGLLGVAGLRLRPSDASFVLQGELLLLDLVAGSSELLESGPLLALEVLDLVLDLVDCATD